MDKLRKELLGLNKTELTENHPHLLECKAALLNVGEGDHLQVGPIACLDPAPTSHHRFHIHLHVTHVIHPGSFLELLLSPTLRKVLCLTIISS